MELTRRSKSPSCWLATAIAPALVKSYCGCTAARAASRACSVSTALTYCVVRFAWTFAGAGLPTSSSGWAGRKSKPRIIAIAAISSRDAPISRPASRRVKASVCSVERASMATTLRRGG